MKMERNRPYLRKGMEVRFGRLDFEAWRILVAVVVSKVR